MTHTQRNTHTQTTSHDRDLHWLCGGWMMKEGHTARLRGSNEGVERKGEKEEVPRGWTEGQRLKEECLFGQIRLQIAVAAEQRGQRSTMVISSPSLSGGLNCGFCSTATCPRTEDFTKTEEGREGEARSQTCGSECLQTQELLSHGHNS